MEHDFTNNHELRVFGLQRSGIHAIVNWIIQQTRGPTLFANDIKSLAGDLLMACNDFHFYESGEPSKKLASIPLHMRAPDFRKEYFILGYEDTDIRHIPVSFSDLIGSSIGVSRTVRNLLIIRDPFNLFASRLGFANNANRHPLRVHRDRVLELWKIHAREALGITDYLGTSRLLIKYNNWFLDQDYRKQIAIDLSLRFSDHGLQSVPGVDLPQNEFARFGCGSSFDNQRFHGKAQDMPVLYRWKRYIHDQFYQQLFADTELIDLSRRLFAPIDGTESIGPQQM